MTISEQEIKYITEVDWPQDTAMPITFPLDSKEDLKIQTEDELLIYGIDYEVNEDKNEVVIKSRTLPKGSVLFRSTPLTQEAEFPQNNKFNSAKLNEVLDKITMQQQEQDEILGRTFQLDRATVYGEFKPIIKEIKPDGLLKITEDGTALEVSDFSPEGIIEEVEQIKEDIIDETQQYVEEARQIEENIETQATDIQEDIDIAEEKIRELEQILDKVSVGMSLEKINFEDWVYEEALSIYRYKSTKLAVAICTFKGNVFDKKLVSNVTIHNEEDGIYIESIKPFEGYIVGTTEYVESEEDVYTTSELLNRMLEVEIIDITNYNEDDT